MAEALIFFVGLLFVMLAYFACGFRNLEGFVYFSGIVLCLVARAPAAIIAIPSVLLLTRYITVAEDLREKTGRTLNAVFFCFCLGGYWLFYCWGARLAS